jgi:hypothetical protein
MSGELAVAIVACAATIVSVVAGAVWVVGQIKGETGLLRNTIDHLSKAVDSLRVWVTEVAGTQRHHGERLVRIETRLDVCEEED